MESKTKQSEKIMQFIREKIEKEYYGSIEIFFRAGKCYRIKAKEDFDFEKIKK